NPFASDSNGVVTIPNSAFNDINMNVPHEYTIHFSISRENDNPPPTEPRNWNYFLDPKLGGHGNG
ncbi:MAG: hypothetical protein OER83_08320, partial [Flavobacteriaceae bacterium]|nr:hypothetical protein [Flavobacteriaceae bacterium]